MNPLTLFLDIVAVGAGLLVDGALLGSLVLGGFYLLGWVRDTSKEAEPKEAE